MSEEIYDGGPAFPMPPIGTGDPRDGMTRGCDGLTKREEFAKHIMANLVESYSGGDPQHADATAEVAVKFADALLRALAKKPV